MQIRDRNLNQQTTDFFLLGFISWEHRKGAGPRETGKILDSLSTHRDCVAIEVVPVKEGSPAAINVDESPVATAFSTETID